MEFKHKEDMELFFKLHPLLMIVLTDMYSWCYERELPFVITDTISTLEEDKELGRVSSSHRTARAADLRVKDWDIFTANQFKKEFNNKYKDIAAIAGKDYKPMLVVLHDSGAGYHAHIQIHSSYSIEY
jgi:hypothetical protein